MENQKTKEQFIQLRAQGVSYSNISKKIGKSKQTLIDWGKELEEEIRNLKAIELEAIYEKYFLLKEARLQSFGIITQRIKEEIESRDFSDIPTEKLLDIFLKYNSTIKEETPEPLFKTSLELEEDKLHRHLIEDLTSLTEPQNQFLKIG
jgi:intein-encoded DNA endonuclease-like protein